MLNLFSEKFNKALKFNVLDKGNNPLKQEKPERFDNLIKGDLSSKNFSSRYYIPENKQWVNSIYVYNRSTSKSLPSANNLADKLLSSFFNLINDLINNFTEKKSSNKRSLSFFWRKNRPSINKVWLSKSETKHTNDKVIITLYMYNKKRNVLIYKLKQLYRDLLLFNRKPKTLSFIDSNKEENITSKKVPRLEDLNNTFTLGMAKSKNEKVLSSSNLSNKKMNIHLVENEEQANVSNNDVYSVLANNNKQNRKYKIFTYLNTPLTKFWYDRPNVANISHNSTHFQMSKFINVIRKNTSTTKFYTAFLSKYHLKHIVNVISYSNAKKVTVPVTIGAKYGYLNNVNLVKGNEFLHNTPYSLHCSKSLSKLHLMSKTNAFMTMKENTYIPNSKQSNETKRNSYYNLIKLYKYVYVMNEYKNNNKVLNNLLVSNIEASNIISSYGSESRKPRDAVVSLYYNKEDLNRKSVKNIQKSVKKNLHINIYNINKLSTLFNNKKNSLFNSSSNLSQEKVKSVINKTSFFNDSNLRNFYINETFNNYVINVYKKEILFLDLLKKINFYSYICKNFFLLGLKNIISKIYKKKVELNIVNLKYIYLNSDIFTQSITKKLRNRRNKLLRLLKMSLNSVSMPTKNTLFYYHKNNILFNRNFMYQYNNLASYTTYISNRTSLTKDKNQITDAQKATILKMSDSLNQWIYNSFYNNFQPLDMNKKLNAKDENNKNKHIINSYNLNKLEKAVVDSIKYKSMFGVRLEASGRLTRRLTASRSVFKFKYIGSLRNTNSLSNPNYSPLIIGVNKPNIQFTKITSKTRNGSFGLKGWVSGH